MSKPHGGRLEKWFPYLGQTIAGEIYGDPRGRFPDGHMIQTSNIVRLDEKAGELETKNTLYKLGKKFVNTRPAPEWNEK